MDLITNYYYNEDRKDMEIMDNGNKIHLYGIDKFNDHYKFSNSLVWNCNGLAVFNGEVDKNFKFDYMIYSILYMKQNPRDNDVVININKLVKMIGRKPNAHKGKINSKVKDSLERLENKYRLIYYSIDGNYIEAYLINTKNEANFYNMYNYKFNLMLNMEKDELYSNRYKNIENALFLYSYIVSRMSYQDIYNDFSNTQLLTCFPSMEEIKRDCKLNDTQIRDLLRQFEADGLIYTINLGNVKRNEEIQVSSNYYVTQLQDLELAYYEVGLGYYKTNGYKVLNNNKELAHNYLAKTETLLIDCINELKSRKQIDKNGNVIKDSEGNEAEISDIFKSLVGATITNFLNDLSNINISFEGRKENNERITKTDYDMFRVKLKDSKCKGSYQFAILEYLKFKKIDYVYIHHFYVLVRNIANQFGC